ncbi:hypothetical protein [Leptospira yasudae]|nr:hypothetical protein [Leptospira yasudae]
MIRSFVEFIDSFERGGNALCNENERRISLFSSMERNLNFRKKRIGIQ